MSDRSKALAVPDVRGEGPFPASEPEYQPPKEHLGLNPANQFQPDPTPTAGPDRSVPNAPVAGGGDREPLPRPGDSPQQRARETGGGWPPAGAAAKEAERSVAQALKTFREAEKSGGSDASES